MAETYKILPIKASPGIKRDGTTFEGTYWTDGQWTRFYRGLPRSMLGYRQMSEGFHGISRQLLLDSRNGYLNLFSGWSSGIEVGQFTYDGFGASPAAITPAGFVADVNNAWQLDKFYTTNGSGFTALLAHAAPNLAAIDSTTTRLIYYSDITSTSAMSSTTMSVSGGVMTLSPFAVAYGDDGLVAVSNPGDPTTWPLDGQFNICATKIVKGWAIRGGQYAPAALMWSLEDVLRMSFVGGTTVWQFDTLSDQSSILSSSGVVENDGIFYWPGVDRWLTFNGVLRELPNNMSLDFFYDNINMNARQKVFGFKIPRWGEICWCAPLFGATECNWMFVWNPRENTWYDTPLPNGGRSAAVIAQTFPFPIMASNQPLQSVFDTASVYPIWQHELGHDEVRGNQTKAILSFATTPTLAYVGGGLVLGGVNMPGESMWTQLVRFEPDFLMGQEINIDILSRTFPMDKDVSIPYQIFANDTDQFDTQQQGRYLRYKISSNVQGGYFVLGQSLIHYRPGDRTP